VGNTIFEKPKKLKILVNIGRVKGKERKQEDLNLLNPLGGLPH
jgi:hypothetical protein